MRSAAARLSAGPFAAPTVLHRSERAGRTREAPAARELAGEALRRMVTTDEEPRRIGRDIGDDVCRGSLELLRHELGGYAAARRRPCSFHAARRSRAAPEYATAARAAPKGKPPSCTFAAALDRPGGRSTATSAQGPVRQSAPGTDAEPVAEAAAGTQRDGKQKIDEPRTEGTANAVTCLYRLVQIVCVSRSRAERTPQRVAQRTPAAPQRLSASSSCSGRRCRTRPGETGTRRPARARAARRRSARADPAGCRSPGRCSISPTCSRW